MDAAEESGREEEAGASEGSAGVDWNEACKSNGSGRTGGRAAGAASGSPGSAEDAEGTGKVSRRGEV